MQQKIGKILADTFRIKTDEITSETAIENIDTWDSLTHMELVANLEEGLGIEFDGDEIADMINFGAIEKIVSRKRSNGNKR